MSATMLTFDNADALYPYEEYLGYLYTVFTWCSKCYPCKGHWFEIGSTTRLREEQLVPPGHWRAARCEEDQIRAWWSKVRFLINFY